MERSNPLPPPAKTLPQTEPLHKTSLLRPVQIPRPNLPHHLHPQVGPMDQNLERVSDHPLRRRQQPLAGGVRHLRSKANFHHVSKVLGNHSRNQGPLETHHSSHPVQNPG